MKKKEAIVLLEKIDQISNNLQKISNIENSIEAFNQNIDKMIKLNDNINNLNETLKKIYEQLLPINEINEHLGKNNDLKQQTNKKVDDLIKQVNYANQRLED